MQVVGDNGDKRVLGGVRVALPLDDYLLLRVVARVELGAVADLPLCHQVVLDPYDLSQGLDQRDLVLHGHARVGEDGFAHDVLDEGEADA
ncbi:hypothetical protein PspLS_01132 [Pyricularia sp. CBS 133598]|nr:hypothetical protein PspLS_01132 [Pyricularia sp. CBS 133598]